MRLLHVIHDYLPKHRAGAEIYVAALCGALARRHHVTVLSTDYDPSRPQGEVQWRLHDGVPVVEVINNWEERSFEDTYQSPVMSERLGQILDTVQPHVVHVHSLLNLSFTLASLTRGRGAALVGTLHDYTAVCPSGGQRLHQAEQHVCRTIDVERCARCFPQSVFYAKLSVGGVARRTGASPLLRQVAGALRRFGPGATRFAARAAVTAGVSIVAGDIQARLDAAIECLNAFDLLVSPSAALAADFETLGVAGDRLRVSDYGFVPWTGPAGRRAPVAPLRVGYVGSLVPHKGVHVLIESLRLLPSGVAHLSIAGDPRVAPEYVAELHRRAVGLPVEFRGRFDEGERGHAYGSLDVLVVPSLWLENSPLVIHEAFMAGVPVVASRIGGIPGLIADDVSGLLVEPGSANALAAALKRFVDEPGLSQRLASGAPPVKTIEQDADEWEVRYLEARETSTRPSGL